MEIQIKNLAELNSFAKKISSFLVGGEILALNGNLGAGKTAFTKALLKAAGFRKIVTSPTFVLMIPYQVKLKTFGKNSTGQKKSKPVTFFHLDFYRTKSFKEIEALGVTDLWGKPQNIFIIEWADKIKKHLPKNTTSFKFEPIRNGSPTARKITIQNAPLKLLKMLK